MDLGLAIFATDESVSPGWLAGRAEAAGFESIFFPEHTHIPASRDTPFPLGDDIPREYTRVVDPFIAATQAAALTTRLRVGTGISLIAQRHPITTAKAVASIDLLSGGRFLFGVGAGWNREALANHGVDAATRTSLMCERIEAMRAIWLNDEASFSGRDVEFERIWCWPKPVQRPHPPILLSGNGERVLERVLAHGDEWMPNIIGGDDQALLVRIARLRELAAAAGRDVRVTINAAPSRPERLALYAEAGVERCVFFVPTAGESAVEQRIERVLAGVEAAGIPLPA
jgi:probable F420-dependent oxidoreductase